MAGGCSTISSSAAVLTGVLVLLLIFVSQPQLHCEASTPGPGLRLRLSQSGLNYAASVAVDKMAAEVYKFEIPNKSGVDNGVARTEYTIDGGRITHFKKPSSHVTVNPGGGVTWSLSGADIRVNGNWRFFSLLGWFFPVWDSGTHETNALGAWLSVTATLGWKSDGTPTLTSTGCSCNLGTVRIHLSGGWGSWFWNFFMGRHEADVKRDVEPKLCEQARNAIDTNCVRQLATLQPQLHCEASTPGPGLRLRLSQSGLNYAASVAVDKMTANVYRMPIPNQSGVDRGLATTEYNIDGGRITYFKKPSSHVTVNPGGGVTWSLSGADIRVNGNWRYLSVLGWFIHIRDSGSYETNAWGAWLSVTATLGWKSDGTPTLTSTGCSCRLGTVRIQMSGGWGTWFYNFFMGGAEADLKRNVEPKLCEEARKAIDTNGVRQLATLQMRIPFLDRWMFDWSLVAAPRFMAGYIESDHRGELTMKGVSDNESFQPTPLRNPTSTPQMVSMWMSEYPMNHFDEVLFKSAILRHTEVLDISSLGQLSGAVPPDLRNAAIEVELTASEAPTLTIPGPHAQGNFSGIATVRARLTGSGNSSASDLLSLRVSVQVLLSPSFNGTHARATVSTLGVSGRVIDSAIGPISDLAVTALCNHLMVAIVVPNLNVVGQRGLPILHMNEDIAFVNAELHLQDGLAVLSTDVRYR